MGVAPLIRTLALEPDAIPAGPVGNGAIVVLDGERLIAIGADGRDPLQLAGDPIVGERCPVEASCKIRAPYAWSADGTLLAFVAGPDDRPNSLYAIAAGGGDPRLITACYYRCTDIAWSADGHRLAFAASNAITVVDMDTGERTDIQLAPCADDCGISPPRPVDLVWSPDGSQIASVSDYNTLTVSATDGSTASMLLEPRRGDPEPEQLAWSSDGSIVFTYRRTGSGEAEGDRSLDVDTAATVNLVDAGKRASIDDLLVGGDGSLVWAQAEGPCPNPGCPFLGSIWTANGDGSGVRMLYDTGCCTASKTEHVFTGPTPSPDGTSPASVIYGEDRVTESGVYVMNLDGTDLRRIATAGTNPAWQPVRKVS